MGAFWQAVAALWPPERQALLLRWTGRASLAELIEVVAGRGAGGGDGQAASRAPAHLQRPQGMGGGGGGAGSSAGGSALGGHAVLMTLNTVAGSVGGGAGGGRAQGAAGAGGAAIFANPKRRTLFLPATLASEEAAVSQLRVMLATSPGAAAAAAAAASPSATAGRRAGTRMSL